MKAVAQKGGILLALLILVLIVASFLWTIHTAKNSLPGEFLYPVKGALEEVRILTTEINNTRRAAVYIDFAGTRLDELEKLDARGAPGSKIIELAKKALDNELLAIDRLRYHNVSDDDPTIVNKRIGQLRQRQDELLDKILKKTPPPDYYTIYDIKDKASTALQNFQ